MSIYKIKITLILILLSIFVSTAVFAETNMYVFARSDGSGYHPGVGIRLDNTMRKDIIGLYTYADLTNQKKIGSESGYTYSLGAQGRVYAEDFYAGIGYGFAGYSSKFISGVIWKKSAWWPHVRIGYDSDHIDCHLTYYPREHQTVNEVEAIKVGLSIKVHKNTLLISELSQQSFKQDNLRKRDSSLLLGVGYRF